ncbi:hypothetical protein QA640_32905 [Bradyrhizobium sp. CB82]|nr:hypothetical protein [Bradyrhizobium sp. CB82]WFU45196.1 hypothetical protein QA640_32905 [Bradyrhizobium sp. CB82]
MVARENGQQNSDPSELIAPILERSRLCEVTKVEVYCVVFHGSFTR